METILTIDFDIIMGPSIELYNHLVNGSEDALPVIEQDIPLIKYANADLNIFAKLTNYLYNIKDKVDFIFIDSHEEIKNYIDKKVNVINIDHHHDLGYTDDTNEITCANWAKKLLEQQKINSYIWIHNPNSLMNREDNVYKIDNSLIIQNFYLDKMVLPSKIIICKSFQWIPLEIRNLFSIWENLLQGD